MSRKWIVDALGDEAFERLARGMAGTELWSVSDGAEIPLIDGGAFDWLARLSSNRRCVFVASGLGAQLVPLLYRRR